MGEERKLAQRDDAMFERNLSILASKGKEIEVSTTLGEKYVGFAAGLDEEFLQVCVTDGQSLALINRSYIVSLEETGTVMDTLDGDGLDREAVRRIRDRVRVFQNISTYHADKRQER